MMLRSLSLFSAGGRLRIRSHLRKRVDFIRNKVLPITTAQALIYRAFTEGKFPVRLLKSVHRHYFEPGYDEFKPRTVWSLSNAFTSAFKEARPDKHFELTARLGKFLGPSASPRVDHESRLHKRLLHSRHGPARRPAVRLRTLPGCQAFTERITDKEAVSRGLLDKKVLESSEEDPPNTPATLPT